MAHSTGTDQAPPEVTKESIRKKVWDHIEKENLANFPRPVTKRIPNFKGAEEAAVKLAELDAFKKAHVVKITPDKPQQHSRYLTIEAQKTLLVPTPRLRTGMFNKIIPPEEQTKDVLRVCSTSQGVREHSVPLGLDANIKIDLVIVGSVAISDTGLRIGKGEGFSDLEYATMMTMGAITPQTPVVTTVHDCQVMDVPESLMGEHDLNVDYIVTPTKVIQCKRSRQQPKGVIWSILTQEKLDRVPILKKIRLIEFRAGKDVRLKDEEEAPGLEFLEEEDRKVDEAAKEEVDNPPPYRPRRRPYYRGRPRRNQRRRKPTDGEEADGEKGSASESDSQKKPPRPRRQRRPRRRTSSRGKDGDQGGKSEQGETEGSGDENQKGEQRKRPYRRRWRRRGPRRASESGDDKENETRANDADAKAGGDRPERRPQRRRLRPTKTSSLYVGNIPQDLRVSVFKAKVRALQVQPLQVIWHGNNKHAFLVFAAYEEVEHALKNLDGMEVPKHDAPDSELIKLNVQTVTRKQVSLLRLQLSNKTRARHGPKTATSDGQTDEN